MPGPFEPGTLLTHSCLLAVRTIRTAGARASRHRLCDCRSNSERRSARGQQHDGCDQLFHVHSPMMCDLEKGSSRSARGRRIEPRINTGKRLKAGDCGSDRRRDVRGDLHRPWKYRDAGRAELDRVARKLWLRGRRRMIATVAVSSGSCRGEAIHRARHRGRVPTQHRHEDEHGEERQKHATKPRHM